MKKVILIIAVGLLLTLSFTFAQTTQRDNTEASSFPKLLKRFTPAFPLDLDKKQLTPEVIKSILPDENREDDFVVQLKNYRITRIITSTPVLTSNDVVGIILAVPEPNWKCRFFKSEEVVTSVPCRKDVRKPIASKEMPITITKYTNLLQENKQEAKIENFKPGDEILIKGSMDKNDKNNYTIEASTVKRLRSKSAP